MVTHVVLMRFADPSDAGAAAGRLESLRGSVPSLLSLVAGVDVSGSTYHLALVTTHSDLAGLAAYAEHPAHVEVLGWLRPRLAARAAVDFES